jgi:hypothetical protein
VHHRWELVPCVGDPVTSSTYCRGLHSVPVPHGHGSAPYVLHTPHPAPCSLQASLPATLPAAPAGTEMDGPWGPSPRPPVDVVPPRCEPLGCQGAPWPVRNCSRRPHGLQLPLLLQRRHRHSHAREVGAVPGGTRSPAHCPCGCRRRPHQCPYADGPVASAPHQPEGLRSVAVQAVCGLLHQHWRPASWGARPPTHCPCGCRRRPHQRPCADYPVAPSLHLSEGAHSVAVQCVCGLPRQHWRPASWETRPPTHCPCGCRRRPHQRPCADDPVGAHSVPAQTVHDQHRRPPAPCVGGPVVSSPCQGLHSVPAQPVHGPAPCVLHTPHPSPCCLQASSPATPPATPVGIGMGVPWGPSPRTPVDVVPLHCEPSGCLQGPQVGGVDRGHVQGPRRPRRRYPPHRHPLVAAAPLPLSPYLPLAATASL